MPELDDQVVLISGGAGGMGAACARTFVAAGARVVVGDVADAEPLAHELGAACVAAHLDVTSETSWQTAVESTVTAHGSLTALINNAGILRRTPIVDGEVDVFNSVLDVNQLGVYLGMRAAAPAIAEAGGGSIVNVSSIDGMVAMRDMAAYVGSKWAVRGMTKVAAMELAPLGIRCNSVYPGYIETPMMTVGGRMSQETKDALAAQVPMNEIGDPQDIAGACAFLISPAARYCNGTELVVDGGLIAGIRPGG